MMALLHAAKEQKEALKEQRDLLSPEEKQQISDHWQPSPREPARAPARDVAWPRCTTATSTL